MDHVDHFYWVLGLQAWSSLKFANQSGKHEMPPEVGAQSGTFASAEIQAEAAASGHGALDRADTQEARPAVSGRPWSRAHLVGAKAERANLAPSVARLPAYPRWLKRAASQPRARNLLVCDESSYLAGYLGRMPSFDVEVRLGRLLAVSEAKAWIATAPLPDPTTTAGPCSPGEHAAAPGKCWSACCRW